MASSIVGILKVLLTADTADFKSGLGDASKVTKQFSGEMKGMATQVGTLSKAFGSMLTVGAFTAAASKVAEYASKIADLSAQTGLSTKAIQEMSHAAKMTGASLENFTNAAFKLGTNLAGGGPSVESAVNRLGLSYASLKAMSPDEQFNTIATALKGVENEQERNRLAVELFGKAAKDILPAIAQGYDNIAKSAFIAGDAQIQALDLAGDALDTFFEALMAAGVYLGGGFVLAVREGGREFEAQIGYVANLKKGIDALGFALEAAGLKSMKLPGTMSTLAATAMNLPQPIRAVTMSMEELQKTEAKLNAEGLISIERNKELQKAAEAFAESLKKMGGADAISGAKEVRKQLEALGGPLKVMPGQLEEMAKRLREGAQAALLMGDADLAAELTKIAKSLEPIAVFQEKWNVKIGEYVTLAPQAVGWTEELNEQLQRLGGNVTTIGPRLKSTMDLSKMWVPFKGTVREAGREWAQFGATVSESLSELSGAFAQLSQMTTGGLSEAVSWLGQLTGSMNLASKAGETMRQGWDKIGAGAKNTFAGIAQAAAGMAASIAAVWQATDTTSTTQNVLGGMAAGAAAGTAILPGWGTAVGAIAGGIIGAFRKTNQAVAQANAEIEKSQALLLKQFGSLERIDHLGRAVGIDLAGAWKSQGEAGKRAFDKLAADFTAAVAQMESDLEGFKGDLDDAISEARDLGYEFDRDGKLVSISFEKMEDAANEFGVDLQALGPAFNAQKVAADAKRIVDVFELLSKGGTDAGTILFGMKDEMSALVQEAKRTGQALPEQMKPWLQNLIDTGQLLDDNGDKITDIGTIQFGPKIETQFERISAKIDTLIDKITDLITTLETKFTPAIDNATRDRNMHIGITTDPLPEFAGLGMGQAGFATGTMGQLGKWFGNFKTGMPAMLHGMEAVVTPNQAVPFALDVLGANAGFASQQKGSAPTPPIQVRSVVENRMFMDGHELKRWILEAVTVAIENNERGIRSRQRDALGIV